ncbi:MAG TPA: 16S rRNA (adenine(1518)-N(6)/adenine(1519)-N(6))-dimethyltransferase RsmA [Caulobacteraceae bacterium]
MNFDSLPPLREQLGAHSLLARKSFGQHFLLDLNITRKIARLAGPLDGHAVIEVGPGPGGLTRALIEAGATVIAVEKDARFLPLLGELVAIAQGRLELVEADALEIDEAALLARHAPGLPALVVANLPYNVGAPLLVKWLKAAGLFGSLTLMFQKEVAERIAARAGSDAYGRLGVLAQAVAGVEIVMSLPARAFTPPPKVESAVVRLTPRPDRPAPELLASLEGVTQAAFGQRRKMLRSSLKSLGGEALCAAAGIDADLRAEVVNVGGFLDLARASLARGA